LRHELARRRAFVHDDEIPRLHLSSAFLTVHMIASRLTERRRVEPYARLVPVRFAKPGSRCVVFPCSRRAPCSMRYGSLRSRHAQPAAFRAYTTD
jgi:hypothetical protein